MYLLGICNNASILEALRVIRIIIKIIQIVVPIILIISFSIEFLSAIKIGNEDLLKKAANNVVRKSIAALLIFLIPTFVSVVVKFSNPSNEYLVCLKEATDENITNARIDEMDKLISTAEQTENAGTYFTAYSKLSDIKDEELRSSYESRLKAVYTTIEQKAKQESSQYVRGGGTFLGGANSSSGSGNYVVEYRDGVFYIPNVRATSDSDTPYQSGIAGTNPAFGSMLESFFADAKKQGYTIAINEGHRYYSVQANYWNCITPASHRCNASWVSCPGGSRHGWGIAADLTFNGYSCNQSNYDCNAAATWAHNNAKNYGLIFRLSNEPWHIEPINIQGGSYGACSAPCNAGQGC